MWLIFDYHSETAHRIVLHADGFPKLRADGDGLVLHDFLSALGLHLGRSNWSRGPSEELLALECEGELPACGVCRGSGTEVLFQTANDCPACGGFGCLTTAGEPIAWGR